MASGRRAPGAGFVPGVTGVGSVSADTKPYANGHGCVRCCAGGYKTVHNRAPPRPVLYRRIQNRAQPGVFGVGFVSVDTEPCAAAPRRGIPATCQAGSRTRIPGVAGQLTAPPAARPDPTQRIQIPCDVAACRGCARFVTRRGCSPGGIAGPARGAQGNPHTPKATTFEAAPRLPPQRVRPCFRHTFRPTSKPRHPTFEPLQALVPQRLRADFRHTFWPITPITL